MYAMTLWREVRQRKKNTMLCFAISLQSSDKVERGGLGKEDGV
jgi:hypothetical protein